MIHWMTVLQVAVIALVTALIRFLPFLIFRKNTKTPELIAWFGKVLPMAVMGMLVVYCLKGVNFSGLSQWLPAALSVAAVVLLHVWKKNTLISIPVGTILYMILIRVIV